MTTLNFYHTFLTFNDLEKETFLKALSEKEKMLVTSISAFPYNVIYPIRDNKTLLYSHLISSLKILSVWTMSKTLSFDKDLTLPCKRQKNFRLHQIESKFRLQNKCD